MYKVINIYDSYINANNIYRVSLLLSNYDCDWYYGWYNGKLQFYSYINRKQIACIYLSNKYNRYNFVSIRIFGLQKVSIYEMVKLDTLSKGETDGFMSGRCLNPDLLDQYYDTIFCNDDIFFLLMNSGDVWNQAIVDIVGVEAANKLLYDYDVYKDLDNVNVSTLSVYPLYYNDSADLFSVNTSFDNASQITYTDPYNIVNDTKYYKTENVDEYILYNSHVIINLNTFYNDYVTVHYNKEYIYPIIVNNEYAIVPLDNNENIDIEDITYDLALPENGITKLKIEKSSNSSSSLPIDIIELFRVVCNYAKYNTFSTFISDSDDVEDIENEASYYYTLWKNEHYSPNHSVMLNDYLEDKLSDIIDYDIILEDNTSTKNINFVNGFFVYGNKINFTLLSLRKLGRTTGFSLYTSNTFSFGLDDFGQDILVDIDRIDYRSLNLTNNYYEVGTSPYNFYSYPYSVSFSVDYSYNLYYDFIYNIIRRFVNYIEGLDVLGFTINYTQSNTTAINDLLNTNYLTVPSKLRNYINNGDIVINELPLSIIINTEKNFIPINTESVISYVYNNVYSNNDITNLWRQNIDLVSVRNNLNSHILDNTNLSSFDRQIYEIYNKSLYNHNFYNLPTSYYSYISNYGIFYIKNKYGESDIITRKTNESFNIKYMKLTTTPQNRNYSVDFFENSIINEQRITLSNTARLYNYRNKIYITDVIFSNISSIHGNFGNIKLTLGIYNSSTHYTSTEYYTLTSSDWTTTNDNILINIEELMTSNDKHVYSCKIDIDYDVTKSLFDVIDRFDMTVLSNLKDMFTICNYQVTAYYNVNNATDNYRYMYFQISRLDNQYISSVSYSYPVTIDIFNYTNLFNYVADDKNIIILNNFFGNNRNNLVLDDLTDLLGSDITQTQIISKYDIEDIDLYLALPFIDNLNRYCKVLFTYDDSTIINDNFNTYEFVNNYNNGLLDNTSVLFMEGLISDYTSDMTTFDSLLKIYRITNNFTISNNVVIDINLPLPVKFYVSLYDSYDDYTNNNDMTTIEITDVIYYNIRNRSSYYDIGSDLYPKLFYIIEYYEVYPEYSLQQEKEYIYDLYFNISVNDISSGVKVSETFFDVCYLTEDVLIAIPSDYTDITNEDDLYVNIKLSDDKNEILDYLNWLIRFKCPNCTAMSYHLKLKIYPKYFNYNILGFTFSSYYSNIKFSLYIPYIFYRRDADTIMVINRDSNIETEKVSLSFDVVLSKINSMIDDNTKKIVDINPNQFVEKIDKPTKSKITAVLFNSSVNAKDVKIELYQNNSPKHIDSTIKELNLAPYDVRHVTIIEDITSSDYTDSFDSGIAYYKIYSKNSSDSELKELPNVKLELPIPCLDEYITEELSLLEKAKSLVKIKYEKYVPLTTEKSKKLEKTKEYHIRITKYDESKDRFIYYVNEVGANIDFSWNTNINYEIICDYDSMKHYRETLSMFNGDIYIKVPFSIDIGLTLTPLSKEGDDIKLEQCLKDSTTSVQLINYFDNKFYMVLIGQQVGINKYNFKLQANLRFINNEIYRLLSENFDLSQFNYFSYDVNIKMFNPKILLNSLFDLYGVNGFNYLIDNYVNGSPVTNDIDLLVTDFINNVCPNDTKITPDKAERLFYDTLHVNYVTEKKSKLISVGDIKLTPVRQHDVIHNGIKKKYSNYQLLDDENFKENNDLLISLKVYRQYLNNKLNIIQVGDILDIDELLFDDVIELFENNALKMAFSDLSYIDLYYNINNESLNNINYVYVNIDGQTDFINHMKINDNFILNKSDVYLDKANTNTLMINCDNLKLSKMNIQIGHSDYTFKNNIYDMLRPIYTKLLEKPIILKTIEDSNVNIIQNSMYTILYEIPIQITKSVDSYITIEKIKITEGGIYNNDYILRTGDLNERYVSKAQNNVCSIHLNKTIDKYCNGLKMLLTVCNIPNTTGSYYTTLLIYYSFNGRKYVVKKDISYNIVLPQSLDNEYLTIKVEQLDKPHKIDYNKKLTGLIEDIASLTKAGFYYGLQGCMGHDDTDLFGDNN